MKRIFTVLLSLILVSAGFAQTPSKAAPQKTPAPFRQNMGQWDNDILFQCLKGYNNVYFYKDHLSFGTAKRHGNEQKLDFSKKGMEDIKAGKFPLVKTVTNTPPPPKPGHYGPPPPPMTFSFLVWDVEFMQANPDVTIVPENKHDSKANYITGEFAEHPLLNVPEFETLTYRELYKGISLKYYSAENNLKYDFIVAPNANAGDISLCFHGVEKLNVNASGELEITTAWGTEKQAAPYSWQTNNGEKQLVNVNYYSINDSTIGFRIDGQYDPNLELTIDPMHVDWSTYFYGNVNINWNWTWISDVHIDKNDHVFLTGITYDKFPKKAGIYDTSFSGGYDGFICKMLPDGSNIDFFTYIGGNQYDWPFAMTGTDDGDTYITGYTGSSDYPISNNAYQKTKGGGYPSFVTGLKADGSALIYSTYVGGTNGTWYYYSQAIDVNKNGEVYIGISSDHDPISTYSKLNFLGGKFDAFVIKFNSAGSAVLASIKIGGTEDDDVNAIYVDPNGNVYICGSTKSNDLIPYGINTNPNIFGYTLNGLTDGYFIKVDSLFTKIKLAKFVGGSGYDMITSIYGDENGEIYIAGISQSGVFNTGSGPNNPANKFPVNYTNNGGDVVFAARMRKDGVKLKWLTFLGKGTTIYWQWPTYYSWWSGRVRIAANIKQEPIIVGQTGDAGFPVTNDAFQTQLKGNQSFWEQDAFITKLNYDGTIQFSSFYGGSSWEFFSGIKVRRIGCVSHVVIAGYTYSDDFPTTPGAWHEKIKGQGAFNSGGVVKIRDTLRVYPIDFGPDEVQCNGVLKFLDGNNIGAKYRWSTGDTIQVLKVTKPGKYWVTSTYGCDMKGDTVTVVLKFSPKVPVLPKDTIYCHALNVTLDAKNDTIADIKYLWNTGDSTQKINIKKQGQYAVKLSTKDCGIQYDTVNIKELHKPLVDIPKDSIFCNAVNINIKLSDPNNEVKYLWQDDNDTFPQRTIKMQGKYLVTGKNYCGSTKDSAYFDLNFAPFIDLGSDSVFCDAVSYRLESHFVSIDKYTKYTWSNGDNTKYSDINKPGKYWMRSENTCGVSSDTIVIGILMSPTINLGHDTTYCDNINLVLDAKNVPNQATYTWGPSYGTNQTYNVSKPGKYYVTVKNKCNTVSDTINFKLLKTPTVNLGRDTNLCVTVSLPLDAGNAGNEATYTWNNGDKAQVFQAIQPGTYSVKVNNYCGQATDSIKVKVYVIPNTKLGSDTVYCSFFPGRTLNAGNNNNLCTYTWNTGETSQSITAASPGIYRVMVENICGKSEDSIRFDVSQNPVVKLAKDTNYCDFFNYDLDAGSGQGYTYYWTPTKAKTQKIVASEFGTHTVVVTNKYGCTGTGSVTINNNCYSEVFVPNVFSPNADQINDIFIPSYYGVSKTHLTIWNRWGQKVFETESLTEGWNGIFQGIQSPEGVYSWQLTYYTGFKRQNKEGTFTLIP